MTKNVKFLLCFVFSFDHFRNKAVLAPIQSMGSIQDVLHGGALNIFAISFVQR